MQIACGWHSILYVLNDMQVMGGSAATRFLCDVAITMARDGCKHLKIYQKLWQFSGGNVEIAGNQDHKLLLVLVTLASIFL